MGAIRLLFKPSVDPNRELPHEAPKGLSEVPQLGSYETERNVARRGYMKPWQPSGPYSRFLVI